MTIRPIIFLRCYGSRWCEWIDLITRSWLFFWRFRCLDWSSAASGYTLGQRRRY